MVCIPCNNCTGSNFVKLLLYIFVESNFTGICNLRKWKRYVCIITLYLMDLFERITLRYSGKPQYHFCILNGVRIFKPTIQTNVWIAKYIVENCVTIPSFLISNINISECTNKFAILSA